MIAKARARHLRTSARKMRMVLKLIKYKSTQEALAVLVNTPKRASLMINKLLRSAIANAKNKGIEEEGLYISKIFADEGATWKRFQANAFGRSSRINKRTCHITLELDKKIVKPKVVSPVKKKRIVRKVKPVK